jgi:hypothetical protein
MNDVMLSTGRDAYLIGVPLIVLLLAGLFRLDELVSRPKRTLKRRRPSYQMDEDGVPVMSDPDGRLSRVNSPAGYQSGPGRHLSLDSEPAEPPGGTQKTAPK